MAFTSTDRDQQHKPYTYQPFPKYITHGPTGEGRVVADDEAWRALGSGWGHPSDAAAGEPAPEPVTAVEDAPKKRGRPRKERD